MIIDVSRRLTDSGLPAAIFSGALRHPLDSYTFAVSRDRHERLWITAEEGGGVNMCLLHEPPRPTGGRHVVLTRDQWELARSVAVDGTVSKAPKAEVTDEGRPDDGRHVEMRLPDDIDLDATAAEISNALTTGKDTGTAAVTLEMLVAEIGSLRRQRAALHIADLGLWAMWARVPQTQRRQIALDWVVDHMPIPPVGELQALADEVAAVVDGIAAVEHRKAATGG